MSVADLKARTQQIFDTFNTHDAGATAAFFAEGAELYDSSVARPTIGPRQIAALYLRHYTAIPDAHVHVDRMVAESNTVAVEWTSTGTHRGKLMGIPPTGKWVSYKGISIIRYRNGIAVADTRMWDLAGLLRQIGLLATQE
jgi:steroid delta-isomerase-like uncharacterized protein